MRACSSPPPTPRLHTATLGLALAFSALFTPTPAVLQPRPTVPLTVRIIRPTAGVVSFGDTVTLTATVSDPTVRTALVTALGATYEVPLANGVLSQNVVVLPGNNRLGVTVHHGQQTVSDSVTFHSNTDPSELIVLLSWASREEIIDLWVREPSGETCKWDHRETNGARLLDFSSTAIGFGSQAYLRARAVAGRYRLKVHYWSSASRELSTFTEPYTDTLNQLHTLDQRLANTPSITDRDTLISERNSLVSQLNQWSRPAGPQTPLRAEAILFANTPHERRWRFELTAQRTGQLQTLGDIEITDPMLRAARTSTSPTSSRTSP